MKAQGHWAEADETALEVRIAAELDAAVDAYLAYPAPSAADMFAHTYASLPRQYEAQRAEAMRLDHA
jgi:TPP-dependent pyruvate/acetoin dehydrogenase alpha subunit